MGNLGQRTIGGTGNILRASAGEPERKFGGITIDWTSITPAPTAITLADGTPIAVGDLYVEMGSVVFVAVDGSNVQQKAVVADHTTTLARGQTFIMDETVKSTDQMSDSAGGPFNGGPVFLKRLKVSGGGGNTNNATLANLLAACPRLQVVMD